MHTGFADIGDAKFYYEVAGSSSVGPTLVLVHAGIADSRMWDNQFHVFARRFHVMRYDRRGFGKTAMVAGPYAHHQDLYELLKFLGIERAALIGCSQGGKTVIDFSLENPLMTEALVLVASALGGFEFEEEASKLWAELEEADEAGDLERVNELELRVWVDGTGRTPEQVDPQVRELVREMNFIALSTPTNLGIEQSLEPAAAHRLTSISAPALIVIGDLDTPRTLAAADELAANIKGARKVVIKNAAHLLNMERPEEFNNHVLSFLDALR